jgi:hypothetical protein
MTDIGSHEDRLRRACKKLGITMKKSHCPYHVLEATSRGAPAGASFSMLRRITGA